MKAATFKRRYFEKKVQSYKNIEYICWIVYKPEYKSRLINDAFTNVRY